MTNLAGERRRPSGRASEALRRPACTGLLLRAAMGALSLVAAIALSCVSCARQVQPEPFALEPWPIQVSDAMEAAPTMPQAISEILEQTNQLRRQQGLEALDVNTALTATAADFAQFMASSDRYGHEADGNTPGERARSHGYDYCVLAENIAYYLSTASPSHREVARSLIEGWQDSPGHRQNMLEPDVTEVGIGVARSIESGRIYAVQVFGRPKSEHDQFRIRNASGTRIEYSLGGAQYPLSAGHTRTHRVCRAQPLSLLDAASEARLLPSNGDTFEVIAATSGALILRMR
ncbi:CAP domain-containing protein [Thiorhodococcus mannitoliphagus]|uniref:CAP domain-containing protein n=1 Tax=Thiorhodococcus mannitoliphagus TaxID=329406 RepID=A0A6P1DV33_9GAMM|nr:CAP domain-containing protein [Thiorhodococcus mannitoliphagus]NEX20831.1 CAP domain-containing protein [Thiorhodococcus mannitoliphagus]